MKVCHVHQHLINLVETILTNLLHHALLLDPSLAKSKIVFSFLKEIGKKRTRLIFFYTVISCGKGMVFQLLDS